MGFRSGEQARRRFVSTLPALLTSKCVRRCVDSGLLPTTIYRPSAPTAEFSATRYGPVRSGGYFKGPYDLEKYAKRHDAWVARGKPPSPPSIPRETRATYQAERSASKIDVLMRLQRGCCYLCQKPFYASHEATLEHVVPKARNGKTHRNVLLAHGACNNEKADRAHRPCEVIYLNAINLRRYSLA